MYVLGIYLFSLPPLSHLLFALVHSFLSLRHFAFSVPFRPHDPGGFDPVFRDPMRKESLDRGKTLQRIALSRASLAMCASDMLL